MINRRRFLQGIAAAAVTPSIAGASKAQAAANSLRPDAGRILDLPEGYVECLVSFHFLLLCFFAVRR